jgi:TolB-like protein
LNGGTLQPRIKMRKQQFGFVLLFSLIAMVAAGVGMAEEPSRVVILPFKINADQDLSFLREGIVDMLRSRLAWENRVIVVPKGETNQAIKDVSLPPSEEVARDIGSKLQASHVLFGSVTIFGNSVSLDGTLVDVRQAGPPLTFFNQGEEMGEVIPQVDLFASEINEKVFGRPVAKREEVAPAPERPGIYAHPETLLAGTAAGREGAAGGAAAGFTAVGSVAPADMTVEGFWKSQNFQTAINGMSLGDVDGDGRAEVVFISDDRVYVHRFENQRLLKIWEKEGKRGHRFIGVDVADVNGNGRAEIFVTSVQTPAQFPDSFVLEWDGNGFKTLSEGNAWYYRVVHLPDRGLVLVGQKGRREDLFVGGVYALTWRDGGYQPADRVILPKGVNVFGFAIDDVMNNGEQMVAAFDQGDHIRVFSLSGEEQWKSDDPYGGSMNYLEFSMSGTSADDLMDRLYLPQRIFIRDMDNDGKNEVIVSSNKEAFRRTLALLRRFNGGHIAALAWNNLGLTPNWRTPQVSGYISDFFIGDFDQDGRDEVVIAQVHPGWTALNKGESSIIGYELPQPPPAQ